MELPPLLQFPQHQSKQRIVSPRPRNLFGHCYMPPSIRKKYIFAATPRNYSPAKGKNAKSQSDSFIPMAPISTMTHTPRPLKRSPAEIRKSLMEAQSGMINLKDVKKEVRELNELNDKAFKEEHGANGKISDAIMNPVFTSCFR